MPNEDRYHIKVNGLAGIGGGEIYIAGSRGYAWTITDEPEKAQVFESLKAAKHFIDENEGSGNLFPVATESNKRPGPWWLVLSGITGPTHEKLYFCEIAVDGVVRVSSQKRDSQVWFSESGIPESLRNDPRFDVIGGE